MEISSETINKASSSRFARLSVDSRQGGEEVVVCKKSFFAWAVHAVRYRFSSNYRKSERALRTRILEGLLDQSPGNTPYPDTFYDDRRGFNDHLITRLGVSNSGSGENSTAVLQGEIRADESGATPGNNQVRSAPDVKTRKVAGGKQKWPKGEGACGAFWEKQGSGIARDGCKNIFKFKCREQPAEFPNVRSEKQLCAKVSDEISGKFNKDGERSVPSHVNSALAYILFTTPEDEQKNLFTNSLIGGSDYPDWGLEDNEREGNYAYCRLPNDRLYVCVNGLLDRNFKPGKSKEQILKGLERDRGNAENIADKDIFAPNSEKAITKLSEEEFNFCVDAMKNFANAYFKTSS